MPRVYITDADRKNAAFIKNCEEVQKDVKRSLREALEDKGIKRKELPDKLFSLFRRNVCYSTTQKAINDAVHSDIINIVAIAQAAGLKVKIEFL